MNETTIFITQIDGIYVILFSLLLGIEVIRNVSAILHTPLMSGANAISGVVLIAGVIQILSCQSDDYFSLLLSSVAVILGTINVSGGFIITHKMLNMFTKQKS